MADGKKVYSLEECSKHRSEDDCWLIIHGKVYNVTEFLDEHPGGYDIVVAASGADRSPCQLAVACIVPCVLV
jgi:cytochrome b involved in lipid metabolism